MLTVKLHQKIAVAEGAASKAVRVRWEQILGMKGWSGQGDVGLWYTLIGCIVTASMGVVEARRDGVTLAYC